MVDDSRVDVLEEKVRKTENEVSRLQSLLVRRGHSAREVILNVLPLVLGDCPIPAGIVRRGKGDTRDSKYFTTITYVNEAFYDCFTHRPEEVVGQSYYNYIDGDYRDIVKKLSGVPVRDTIKVKKKNGDLVTCYLVKNDLYMPFCGKPLFVLSWFYLYPVEEKDVAKKQEAEPEEDELQTSS